MNKLWRVPFRFLGIASLLLLAACQPAATPVPTDTPTDIPSSTLTIMPTATDTPTFTPTNTETQTATPTFTSTPPYNMPGLYYLYKCVDYIPRDIPITINFCVQSVKVNTDLTMQFNVYWRTYIETYNYLIKRSVKFDTNFYVTDNLENKYDAMGWGGKVAEDATVSKAPTAGWFLFPAAKSGATSFTFWDMYNMVSIDDIVLLNEADSNAPDQTRAPGKPHPTDTPPPTLNPDLKYNEPGTYWLYKCKAYPVGGNFSGADSVTFCLNTVVVNEDRTMKFNINWKVLTLGDFIKPSDANNPNIFLVDNLGNKYHHIQAGGCAAGEFRFYNPGNDCNGWFMFPAAQPGVTSFRYVDDSAAFILDGIVLAKE